MIKNCTTSSCQIKSIYLDQWELMQFLPFATDHEYWTYTRLVVNVIPTNEETIMIEWCKNVDGANFSPSCQFIYRAMASAGTGIREQRIA